MNENSKNYDTITYDRSDILVVLRHLNTIVGSAARIGSANANLSEEEGNRITIEFLRDWSVFVRLAECRAILSDRFSRELGPDDMDELEREMVGFPHWSVSHPKPPPKS